MSAPAPQFYSGSRVDLDTRIRMLLDDTPDTDPDFSSTMNKDSDVPCTVEDLENIDFNLNFLPLDNYDDQSDSEILGCFERFLPLSNPPSPFLSKEIYLKCYEAAVQQLKINKEKERQELESSLSHKIRNSKFIFV